MRFTKSEASPAGVRRLSRAAGFVLPAAIERETLIAAGRRDDREVHLYALDIGRHTSFSLDDIQPAADERWSNYSRGVTAGLLRGHVQEGPQELPRRCEALPGPVEELAGVRQRKKRPEEDERYLGRAVKRWGALPLSGPSSATPSASFWTIQFIF